MAICTTKKLRKGIVQTDLVKVLKYWETNGTYDIGTNFWNKGRTAEIGDRVLHL